MRDVPSRDLVPYSKRGKNGASICTMSQVTNFIIIKNFSLLFILPQRPFGFQLKIHIVTQILDFMKLTQT